MRQKEEREEWGPGSRPWGSPAGRGLVRTRPAAAGAKLRGVRGPEELGWSGRGCEGEGDVKEEPRGPGPASGWCFAIGVSGQEARQARKCRVHGESHVGCQGAGDTGTRNGGDGSRGALRKKGAGFKGQEATGKVQEMGAGGQPPFNARR